MERLSVLIISAVVSVILFATVLMPIVTSSTTDTIVKDLDNGEGLGVMLSLEDGTEDKTLTAVLSAGTVTLSGDYSGTVDTAEDSIIMLSDDTALLVKGGELLYMNGGRYSSVTSQTVNLSAGAYEWAYFPDENGTFVSYAAYDNNISGNVVSVGAFAGVGVISVNDTVTSTNDLGLVPTIITGENDSIEGVVYALPEEEEEETPELVSSTARATIYGAKVNPSSGTQVGDLFYTTSGSDATVVGVSSDTLSSVTIPDTVEISGTTYTVTAIGAVVFTNMTSLTSVTMPSGLTSIGNSAFSDCTNLALTSLPAGVTIIGLQAFYNCTNLALTSLPAGVTIIGGSAFSYCTNLKHLVITSSPTIGNNAFSGAGLTELLNLGSTEITAGSYGLSSTATVRNNIEDVALVQIKELHVNETVTKEGAEYELLALVPALVILALVAALAMSFIARRE